MEIKQCPVCGKDFETQRRYSSGFGKARKTCSRKCGAHLHYGDPVVRFWNNVDQSGGPDACWLWKKTRNNLGYVNVGWEGRVHKAHRVAYLLANGHWSEDDTLHTCDNRACCNPAHLFNGTHDDNMADMKAKGRRKGKNAGEKNGNAKLTEADAHEIKRLLSEGVSQQEIADGFGIYQTQVSKIKLGKVWKEA